MWAFDTFLSMNLLCLNFHLSNISMKMYSLLCNIFCTTTFCLSFPVTIWTLMASLTLFPSCSCASVWTFDVRNHSLQLSLPLWNSSNLNVVSGSWSTVFQFPMRFLIQSDLHICIANVTSPIDLILLISMYPSNISFSSSVPWSISHF
jgi:hypothetical protein